MLARKQLKWRGLGDSEYVSHCGTWLVHLHGRAWHLYRRAAVERDSASSGPSWTWSTSLYQAPRKGACQDHAQDHAPQAQADTGLGAPESPQESPGALGSFGGAPRGALGRLAPSEPHHNARCHECGVPFTRDSKHRFGPLCGKNCRDDVREILAEATP